MPLPTIIIAALLAVAPPAVRTDPIMRRPDAPMRLPAVARAHTAVISVDRARIERFAREGGGLLAMPLANTRVAMPAFIPRIRSPPMRASKWCAPKPMER